MSEISMYEAQKKKMEGLCEEHDLTYRFQKDTYPPTFTISRFRAWTPSSPCWKTSRKPGTSAPKPK